MSLVYNDTITRRGIIQQIERNCGFNSGDISGNAARLLDFTADINLALDEVYSRIFQVGGTWQFDDSNHTDYPIITTDLVSGQRDYSFTGDGSSNLILEFYKVLVADSNGIFREITPVDQQSNAPINYLSGQNTGGQPNSYDKTGNGLFLDPVPNYSRTGGIKILISREGSYFTTADTTKKPGFAGLFHEYLALRPAYYYHLRNQSFALADRFKNDMATMEQAIEDYYKLREKDNPKEMTPARNNSR